MSKTSSAKTITAAAVLIMAIAAVVIVFAMPGVENTARFAPFSVAGCLLVGVAISVWRMWWSLLLVPIMLWPISGWIAFHVFVLMSGDEPLHLSF